MNLSTRFEEALVFAVHLHSRQKRKGTKVPYASHLLSVTALVLEDGGSEDEAIAALLHDSVEDQGGMMVLGQIRKKFGPKVAEIVLSCSDSTTLIKAPWQQRKENYLSHLQTATPEAVRVSLADKLHNARSILRDLGQDGDDVWKRFTGGRDGSLWYYRSLVEIFQEVSPSPMVEELSQIVTILEGRTNHQIR